MDVDIINISCGSAKSNKNLKAIIQQAFEKDIVIVASAGNFMKDDILYPASYNGVLAVGSISKTGEIISPLGNIEKNIIYLPGEHIVTTAPDSSYTSMFGTSPATAILTGIIAIILEANPELSNEQIYEYFNNNSTQLKVTDIISKIGG